MFPPKKNVDAASKKKAETPVAPVAKKAPAVAPASSAQPAQTAKRLRSKSAAPPVDAKKPATSEGELAKAVGGELCGWVVAQIETIVLF